MNRVQLRRVDEAQNMRRFYSLALQPDLFGGCDLVREWGRIGQAGTVKRDRYPSPIEAQQALEAKQREKEKGGYHPT
jgi:predicted DNA-binding WGR domain protein